MPPPTEIAPIVDGAGTLVTVIAPPLLKARMSSVAGVVRVGFQLVDMVQDPDEPPIHV